MGGRVVDRDADLGHVHAFVFDPPDRDPERTIVLVHGLGDASTAWYRMVPKLREHARVVAVDLPPFGLSELHEDPAIGPDEQAQLLAPLIREHAIGDTTLAGHSLGGWVAQWLVAENPDLVDRALLIAPAGARLEGAYDALDLLTPHTAEDAVGYVDALWYDRPLGVEAVAGDLLDRLHGPEIRGFLTLTGEQHLIDEGRLTGCRTPINVVWGQADELIDPETPAYFAEHWGGPVKRTYLARAGHMVHLERPATLERLVGQAAGLDRGLHLQRRPVLS